MVKTKVYVTGHSFVRRLGNHILTSRWSSNFDTDNIHCLIQGRSGGTVSKLLQTESVEHIRIYGPSIVCVHIGENDIDSDKFDISHFCVKIEDYIDILLNLGVKGVVFIGVYYRDSHRSKNLVSVKHENYKNNRALILDYFSSVANPSVLFHKIKKPYNVGLDGVHLDTQDLKTYFNTVRSAIRRSIKYFKLD